MEILKIIIKENKPNIAASTVNSYATNLKSLFYSHNPKKLALDPVWFHNQPLMLEILKEEPIIKQSNFLTALIAYNSNNEAYKLSLLHLSSQLKQKKDTQDMSPKENKNWI